MLDFKKEISKLISKELNMEDDLIYSFIQLTKDETNGDYSFPCFSLAKTLRKSPMMIADELKEKIGIKKAIKDYVPDEKDFLDRLDAMCEQAFDDQCTGANPRYPLISEIKDMYLRAYYGK